MSTHSQLVERAVRWLYGTKKCNVVLSGIASCSEVPDAIGWSNSYKIHGSIVVECKTSVSDLHRDKKKAVAFKHPDGYTISAKHYFHKAKQNGYEEIRLARMGHYRYFLISREVRMKISPYRIVELYPDHGVLLLDRNRVSVLAEAERRNDVNLASEVRLLQFALIHIKHNLLNHGCKVNMCELTKYAGQLGITFPKEEYARGNRSTVSPTHVER